MAAVRPIDIRFEHHGPAALGIAEARPRISWSFEGDAQNWRQASYELEVLWRDNTFASQCNISPCNSLVPWPWRALVSSERASVRVRVVGEGEQHASMWSEYGFVEAGLLDPTDWRDCCVIEGGYTALSPPRTHRPVVFRRAINLDSSILAARLYVTAHGVYEACMNGHVVGDHVLAPGWTSYRHRLLYQTFDVTNLLRGPGENLLEITVAEGWYCGRLGFLGGRSNIYGESPGVIALLYLHYGDERFQSIQTDERWTWTYGPVLASGLYDGEIYDGRVTSEGDRNVRTRPINCCLCASDGPPVRRTAVLDVQHVLATPSGKTILDFGQNFVGRLRIRLTGLPGSTVSFRHAEVLENGELALRPLRGAEALDTLIIGSAQTVEWEPRFTFHGFRYVQVDGWPGILDPGQVKGIVVHTDMRRTGHFTCSSDALNRLHENVVWSMRSNFISIPTDCPQRDERLGWTGDINVFAETGHFLYDTTGMLISWLKDLHLEQADGQGIVPLTVPNVIEGLATEAHAVWGDVSIMLPWLLFSQSGDKYILERQYQSMESWLACIPRLSSGLWNYTAQWRLGDWLDPAAPPEDPGNATTDPACVSDAFLVHVTELLASVSQVLGKSARHVRYKRCAEDLRKAFADEYITPSGRMSSDTQTAYTLGLHFSLFPTKAQASRAAERLEELVKRNSRFCIATGFAGTPYIGHAMKKAGLTNLFYRMLLHRQCPSWLYPVTIGATTIWERWDSMLPNGRVNPGEMTSFNHYALGAVAAWMHCTILGLRSASHGWQTVEIEPNPGGGISWAKGFYETPSGTCWVCWRILTHKAKDQSAALIFRLQTRVPPNVTARVKLPGVLEVDLRGSGEHVWEIPYIPEPWPPRAMYPPTLRADDDLPIEAEVPFIDDAQYSARS